MAISTATLAIAVRTARAPAIRTSDGDGVGDDCDPRPALAGDQRALWLGFYDSDSDALVGWTRSGSFSLADGRLVSVETTSLDVFRGPDTWQRPHVETAIRLDDFADSNAVAGVISGWVSTGGNLEQFYQCAVFNNGDDIGARSASGGNTIDDQYLPWPGSLANTTVLDVVASFSTAFDCTYAPPATTVTSTRAGTAGRFEFVVQRASVSFDYLFLVEIGS